MHLKSLSLKGFKSFPDRTRLDFGPGVSVVVGPNGSGKSNITDAVLWAMGEQSPVAVRGQSMQDVIFGGGRGQQARAAAEVEIVIEADGPAPGGVAAGGQDHELDFTELSIVRRLDRSGEGEYRLNGARCRLVDVIEALSDTGLGKESHSVVSQGRVESIVTSRPRDRRMLIEEAAGLGKHRRRRRRAQLKLGRTQDNLGRALDIEREARSRLRPLKRQAVAAELHARLERQTLEARWELARGDALERRTALTAAERDAAATRAQRDEADRALRAVATRREESEQALARRSEQREALSRRAFAARSAGDPLALRIERGRAAAEGVLRLAARAGEELDGLRAQARDSIDDASASERITGLEGELARLERDRADEVEREVASLEAQRAEAAVEVDGREAVVAQRRAELALADERADLARGEARQAERGVERARREAAGVGADLASANQFLRSHAGAPGGARALADALEVEPGCELAVAAALDGRLRAAIVDDLSAGATLLDRAGRDGGSALVRRGDVGAGDVPGATAAPAPDAPGGAASRGASSGDGAASRGASGSPDGGASGGPSALPRVGASPAPAARRLVDLVRGPADALSLVAPLLHGAWLVDDLAALPEGFPDTAVTRSGRVWFGTWRELRQVAAGGADRVLAERYRRERLIVRSEEAARAERAAIAAVEVAAAGVASADAERDAAERGLRDARREQEAAVEGQRRIAWLIEQRRSAPDEGPGALRRARLGAELQAERRLAERIATERAERAQRVARLEAGRRRDEALAPRADRVVAALEAGAAAIESCVAVLEAELRSDREAGERLAADLRACAQEEAELQAALRARAEAVTGAEVRAQQARDRSAEADEELAALAGRLGLDPQPAAEELAEEQRVSLLHRIAALQRRREQLGPVNPLAKDSYDEAVAHVSELERQREDLETAMRELGSLITDTDRQIRETFEQTFTATARNFSELVAHLFPGGQGRLRLVREDAGPRPVLGGQPLAEEESAGEED
ncbi:MAG: chromosome segregation SMC family protein, partial [Solirubrobacteraceae bacterium]